MNASVLGPTRPNAATVAIKTMNLLLTAARPSQLPCRVHVLKDRYDQLQGQGEQASMNHQSDVVCGRTCHSESELQEAVVARGH